MFDNIGGKIKALAVVLCILGMVLVVILGCMLFEDSVLTGLVTIVAGCVASWIGSFFVYGFGQLVEDTSAIREALKGQSKTETVKKALPIQEQRPTKSSVAQAVPSVAKKVEVSGWTCSKCQFFNTTSKDKCSLCGESK